MKAILVIDVPDDMRIKDTKALQITLFNGLFTRDLSINQQLRPLPSKRESPITKTFGTPFNKGRVKGWNDCIDAIRGETE